MNHNVVSPEEALTAGHDDIIEGELIRLLSVEFEDIRALVLFVDVVICGAVSKDWKIDAPIFGNSSDKLFLGGWKKILFLKNSTGRFELNRQYFAGAEPNALLNRLKSSRFTVRSPLRSASQMLP